MASARRVMTWIGNALVASVIIVIAVWYFMRSWSITDAVDAELCRQRYAQARNTVDSQVVDGSWPREVDRSSGQRMTCGQLRELGHIRDAGTKALVQALIRVERCLPTDPAVWLDEPWQAEFRIFLDSIEYGDLSVPFTPPLDTVPLTVGSLDGYEGPLNRAVLDSAVARCYAATAEVLQQLDSTATLPSGQGFASLRDLVAPVEMTFPVKGR